MAVVREELRDLCGELEAHLEEAALWLARLEKADLRGAFMRGANLQGADLREAQLNSADLRAADLRGAWLEGTKMGVKTLTEPNLHGALYDRRTRWPAGFSPQAHGARWAR